MKTPIRREISCTVIMRLTHTPSRALPPRKYPHSALLEVDLSDSVCQLRLRCFQAPLFVLLQTVETC